MKFIEVPNNSLCTFHGEFNVMFRSKELWREAGSGNIVGIMKGRYLDATHHGLVNSIHSIGQQKKPYVSLSTNPMIINFEKLKRPAFAKEIAEGRI